MDNGERNEGNRQTKDGGGPNENEQFVPDELALF